MKTPISRKLLGVVILLFVLLSTSQAEDISAQIDKIFEQFDSTHTPGVAVAVIQDNDIIFEKAYGMASLELGVPNTVGSVFRVGSVSKQFTAACIAMLAQENKLALSDPIVKYLPELPKSVYGPVTISHMLHHTSGIRDSEALYPYMGIEYAQWYTHDMLLEMLARQKALSFPPGEMLEYSNSAFTLLALIIERVTKMPFQEFLKARILDPLNMDNTRIQTSYGTLIPMRTAGYDRDKDGYTNWMTNNQLIGHDALYSSVGDMAAWAKAFYDGKLDATLIKMMTTTGTFNDGTKNNYALGIISSHYKGLKTLEHSGWYVGYTAYLIIFPEQKFSVVCLANNVQGNRRRECLAIAEIYLGDQLAHSLKQLRESAQAADQDLLQRLPGDYLGQAYGGMIQLEVKDGLPRPQGAQWSFEPSPFNRNEFINYDNRYSLRIISGIEGGDMVIDVLTPMARIDRFRKLKETEFTLDDPSPYLGEYWSEEIGTAAIISEKDAKLRIKISLVEGDLTAIGSDLFRSRSRKLEFFRNELDRIAGFKFSTSGFQGVIFKKR